jgi:hypothetical protein
VLQAQRVHKAPREIPVKLERKALRVIPVPRVLKVPRETLDLKVKLARLVLKALRVIPVQLAHKAFKALRERKARKVKPEPPVHRVPRVIPELKVKLEPQVPRASKVSREFKD